MARAENEGAPTRGLYTRLLVAGVDRVVAHPVATLVVAGLLTLLSAVYGQQTLRMNSDDATLISQDEPFRRDYAEYARLFPQFDETTLIVLSSRSVDRVEDAVDRLSTALRARPDLVATLYSPTADSFFEDHGLLYMEQADLDHVIEQLAEAQPALTALARDSSLRGLFDELELAVDQLGKGETLPSGFARMTKLVTDVAEDMLAGGTRRIRWADEFFGTGEEIYRMIVVQGRKHFDEPISAERFITGIRETAKQLEITPENGVRMRLTGFVPLGYDELETLQRGLVMAGTLSVALLGLILGFGVRSLRIVSATVVSLLASLCWSTAWAMASVGEFNIISSSFAILLIGLGVDFAIHFGLRYEEETRRGLTVPDALHEATAATGGPVSLCALTSAIGFLSFVPTRYYGLGALGIIAGGGMGLALIASFTVFPAMLALMRAPTPQSGSSGFGLARLHPLIVRHSGTIVVLTLFAAAAAAVVSSRMTFDFSTLSMKDPLSESMTTLRELQQHDMITDYAANILAPDLSHSEALVAGLSKLPPVSEARAPTDYLPDHQEDRLAQLEEAAFFLEPALYPTSTLAAPEARERLDSLRSLEGKIAALSDASTERSDLASYAHQLGHALERLASGPEPERAAAQLEKRVVSDLRERIDWLRRALEVEPIGFDDLPRSLRNRLLAPDGRALVVALPREDLRDIHALRRFVEAVQSVDPHATGRPVVEAGIGNIVVSTFRMAIGIAALAIGLVLLLTLRRPLDALLVLTPITLAAFFTTAIAVLIHIPFNMANVVVIPLILGLGVDNGIHVFMRYRDDGSLADTLNSSTPRAVLLSALTTLAAFGSLAVSPHNGIHSMGVLLSVSVLCLIVCALIALPALIAQRQRMRRPRHPSE